MVKILTFSVESAGKVMGGNGLDCPVILGPRELNFLGGGRGYAGALTRLSTRHLLLKIIKKMLSKIGVAYLR